MKEITRDELKARLDSYQDVKLVFTLGEWQYQAMHIPGSLDIPCCDRLYASADSLSGLEREDEIVVYGSNATCGASISMYYYLVQHGYTDVSHFTGGLLDWESAGFPVAGDMAGEQGRNRSPGQQDGKDSHGAAGQLPVRNCR